MSALRVGSLFSGYGGLDMAVRSTLGGGLAWHCDNDPAASRLLAHRHPDVPNLGDITAVEWAELAAVDVLTGGFPCFPAGTLVDGGADGLRPIETLRVGDRVLTHARRRRRVTSVMRREADDVLSVKAMGAPAFRATAEHPFYIRRRRPGRPRVWSAPEWVAAGELVPGDMLAMPLDDAGPRATIGADLAYVLGRWLGDGWLVDHRRTSTVPAGHRGSRITSRVHKAIVCAAPAEADDLAVRIAAAGLHGTRAAERTVVKFHISSMELVKMLRDFGRGAAGKRLPGWVFTASAAERAALLQGWLDADGSRQASGAWRGTTVSEELAYGMSRLGRNVHQVATSVHRFDLPGTTVIEGRTVRQRPQFQVVIPPRNRESFVEDGYAWVPVRSVTEAEPCEVFNVSVEDDESYTAWGFAVHNCQDVSSAGRRAGMTPDSRSGLWAHMARAINVLQPHIIVIENVRGLLSADAACDVEPSPWGVGDRQDRPLRALGAVLGDLAVLGYDARWCGVRAADVGAPHPRFRVFVVARPTADAGGGELQRRGVGGVLAGPEGSGAGEGPQRQRDRDAAGDGGAAAADADGLGPVRGGAARRGRGGPADNGVAATDAAGIGRGEGRPEPAGQLRGSDAPVGGAAPAPDPVRDGREGHPERDLGPEGGQPASQRGDAAGRVLGGDGPAAVADAPGVRDQDEQVGSAPQGQPVGSVAGSSHRDRAGDPAEGVHELDGAPGELAWGVYAPAIQRWERVLGRPAPAPTQTGKRGGQQLSPAFVEWMMGLPVGHVTDVPGLSRNDQLKILGNGVVPAQAELALRHLLAADVCRERAA